MRQFYPRSIKKNLYLLFSVCIILFIMGRFGLDQKFKQTLTDRFHPVLNFFNTLSRESKNTFLALIHFRTLKKQNDQLNETISILKNKLKENQDIRLENKRLNELLGFKSRLSFESIPAKIIGGDASNWNKSLLLDKGKIHGITLNQAVLCSQGVVGRIASVNKNTSRVMVIIDKNCQMGGLNLRTRDMGIIQGQNTNTLKYNYLSRQADIKQGDLVITSGIDDYFPKGIIIGEVLNVYHEDYGLYKYCDIMPTVDFKKVEEVLVIKTNTFEKGLTE